MGFLLHTDDSLVAISGYFYFFLLPSFFSVGDFQTHGIKFCIIKPLRNTVEAVLVTEAPGENEVLPALGQNSWGGGAILRTGTLWRVISRGGTVYESALGFGPNFKRAIQRLNSFGG